MDRIAENLALAVFHLRRLGINHRETYSEVLRRVLDAHPRLIGVWMVWEPNCFDGRDTDFRFTPGHDHTGRFVPYWHRAYGSPKFDPAPNYEHAGVGDWYQIPRRAAVPCELDNFWYSVAGKTLCMRSVMVPIVENGVCLGVVGIDAPATNPIAAGPPPNQLAVPVVRTVTPVSPLNRLSAREREIHHWLVEGKSNEEIGRILGISTHTVKNHLSRIFEKLGVENRTAAALCTRDEAGVPQVFGPR